MMTENDLGIWRELTHAVCAILSGDRAAALVHAKTAVRMLGGKEL